MTAHVMVDLETMSSSSHAAIIAIGAVRFEPLGPQVLEPPEAPKPVGVLNDTFYYANVSLESSMAAGLEVNADTIMWWLKQDEASRKAVAAAPMVLAAALMDFKAWYGDNPSVPVWSHATFDFPILSHAFEATNIAKPFKYTAARDVRTIYDLAYPGSLVPNVSVANKHNALWDAWRQAVGVQHCAHKLIGLGE